LKKAAHVKKNAEEFARRERELFDAARVRAQADNHGPSDMASHDAVAGRDGFDGAELNA
jgi:hypothetical protein